MLFDAGDYIYGCMCVYYFVVWCALCCLHLRIKCHVIQFACMLADGNLLFYHCRPSIIRLLHIHIFIYLFFLLCHSFHQYLSWLPLRCRWDADDDDDDVLISLLIAFWTNKTIINSNNHNQRNSALYRA